MWLWLSERRVPGVWAHPTAAVHPGVEPAGGGLRDDAAQHRQPAQQAGQHRCRACTVADKIWTYSLTDTLWLGTGGLVVRSAHDGQVRRACWRRQVRSAARGQLLCAHRLPSLLASVALSLILIRSAGPTIVEGSKPTDRRGSANWYDVPFKIMVPKRGTGANLLVPVALSTSAVAFSSTRQPHDSRWNLA